MIFKSLIIEIYLYVKSFFSKAFPQSNYYKMIKLWEEKNKKRKHPRTYHIFRLEGEDAKKNAIFSSFKLGIKWHMIFRGYISKIASLLPPCNLQKSLFRFAGLRIEKDVFLAPELTIDVIVDAWTRFHRGCSIGIRVNCFNHLFEQNGRIILGYIDIGEEASIGGFVTISPGVTIGKKADIGAEVKIGPGVKIGDYAKIGPGSTIGSFVKIGDGAEIKSCSVILRNIPPYTRAGGNPATILPEKTKYKRPRLDLIYNKKDEIETAKIARLSSSR